MDSSGRAAADIALACVVAAFLVAGAAFTAGAVLGPRPALDLAVSMGNSRAAASIAAGPGSPRSSQEEAGRSTPSTAPPSVSQPSATQPTVSGPAPAASTTPRPVVGVARVTTNPPSDGGQVQAGGDIQAGDGAGDHDGS